MMNSMYGDLEEEYEDDDDDNDEKKLKVNL